MNKLITRTSTSTGTKQRRHQEGSVKKGNGSDHKPEGNMAKIRSALYQDFYQDQAQKNKKALRLNSLKALILLVPAPRVELGTY